MIHQISDIRAENGEMEYTACSRQPGVSAPSDLFHHPRTVVKLRVNLIGLGM